VDSAVHAWRSVDELFADPEIAEREFDVVVAVVGNSHFHLPFIELLNGVDCTVIAHDTRMTEFYLALRDRGGLAQVMLRTSDSQAPASITPSLDDQVEDLRLLQNAAMWEIARQSHQLILHSPTCAPLIERQTSVAAHVLPFAHYRVNDPQSVGAQEQAGARARLGLDSSDNSIHIGTFGYVDLRTKQVDVVVEAAGWLTMWGHPVVLHVVGSADDDTRQRLEARAQELDLEGFRITGYQSEDAYRDWLMAVDRGIQLRISPLLGVSGPLADLSAYGIGALASEGLCRDVRAPAYIERLPDSISPIGLAEAILNSMNKPLDPHEREKNRLRYLDEHDPNVYARRLHDLLEQSVR
jgi:glycosyltransferase involved in cell wall biosynthesis